MNTIFKYQNQQVRTITDENEQTWFVGIDVCNILGYAMASNVIKDNLDEDERKLTNVADGSGQSRKSWTVNEFGLYSLVLTSSKPEAKTFKRWITHDVLPSIRKAGKYTTAEEQKYEADLQKLVSDIEVLKQKKEDAQKLTNKLRKDIEDKTTELVRLIKTDKHQLTLMLN
tara:strand:- start:39780 stop:40292 length:513 start_codon:yes stop_codon:yes gene_type:complete